MSPDPTGVAAPREPGDGNPTSPRFRGVEQVDETTAGGPPVGAAPASAPGAGRQGRVRARKVHRIVRHIEPWSVLKVSLLFFLALFLIIGVASAVLWSAARSSGAVANVEDLITENGGFGNCPTPTTVPGAVDPAAGVSSTTSTTIAPAGSNEGGCADGAQLEGGFKFEDKKLFEALALGGVVLVLAGSAAAVVMALLFNLMSDLTGGIRVTVLEEEPRSRAAGSGSPSRRHRD